MQQEERIIKKIVSTDFIVGLRDDGIYHVYVKDNVEIDLKVQAKMHQAYQEITQGEKGFFIYEAGHKCNVTKEARDHSIILAKDSPMIATCAYVQNSVYRMIATFFVRINQPKSPFWITGDFEEGINWLKSVEKTQLIAS